MTWDSSLGLWVCERGVEPVPGADVSWGEEGVGALLPFGWLSAVKLLPNGRQAIVCVCVFFYVCVCL